MSDRQKSIEKIRATKSKPQPSDDKSPYTAHTITFNKDGFHTKMKKTPLPQGEEKDKKKKKDKKKGKKKKQESSSSSASSNSTSSDSEPVKKKKLKSKLLPSHVIYYQIFRL